MMKGSWYKLICPMAHQGTGKFRDTTNYVYAEGIIAVLSRYKKMPGVKRNNNIPSIEKLDSYAALELEQEIKANNISLDYAKRTWYFGVRR